MTLDATAVSLIIGTAAAAVVLIIKALGDKQLAAIRALAEQAAEIKSTAKVIEGHTNSAATRDASALQAKDQQIVMLRESLAKAEATALALASATAVKPADAPKV